MVDIHTFGGPRQRVLILTEDGRIQEGKLRVERGFMVDHRFRQAWGLMPNAGVAMRGTDRVFHVLYERALAPFSATSGKWLSFANRSVSEIAGERLAETMATIQKDNATSKLGSAIRFAVVTFALMIAFVVAVGLLRGGVF